ncbi:MULTISPECIES: hypothetical protein [Paenibacillus]|uniref:hypothetical protein n=1 Tax=Paenibacillus TaxID=44249 RepID=UPI002FE27A20
MNIKHFVIVGTIACVITIVPGNSGHLSKNQGQAAAYTKLTDCGKPGQADEDGLLAALGLPTEHELYDALLEGQSLTEVAAGSQADPEAIIRLQTEQLQRQLTERFTRGQLSKTAYLEQMKEVPELIRASAEQSYRILG